MKISVHTIASPLHDKVSTEAVAAAFIKEIEEAGGMELELCGSDFSRYGESELDLVYIITGGTEGAFRELLPKIKGHVKILTSGKSNSLAASLEILSYLRQQGRRGEIIHGSCEYIAGRIKLLAEAERARKSLKGKRIGIIGSPSDWLIASHPDPDAIQNILGIELVELQISELIAEVGDISKDRMEGAEQIYQALKNMVNRHRLDGLTLRCFDLLEPLGNTGCLGLAKLNSEGIASSCEGDIPALISMMIGSALTGQSGFQANPSRIDPQRGEYLFAHCTLPLNMTESYSYDTHFESGLGVAIRGVLPCGKATIFKVSGDLSRCFIQEAELVRNQAEPNLCRTQIVVKAENCADYFLKNPISNHHLIFTGDHAELFRCFWENIHDNEI